MKKKNKTPSNVFKNALRFGRYLLALAILFFLFKHFSELLQELNVESISFNPFWLLTSCAILIVYRTLRIFPWLILYQSATSKPVSFLSSWILFQLSELGRYLPGKVGQFVGIAALCRSLEISRDEAIASTLLQLMFQCLLGVFIGVPVLLSPAAREFLQKIWTNLWHNSFRSIALFAALVGLGAVFFILLRKHLFSQKAHLQKAIRSIFSFKKLFRLIAIYLLLWAFLGIGFFLFVKSIYPIQIDQLPIILSVYPFAWSIGFLSLITPGGLGVREGVLSIFLTPYLPPGIATLVALLSRLWVMNIEVILAGIAWGCYCKRSKVNR
jgi:hypothetical protein